MAELGAAADAQTPALRNLNASAGQLATLPRATSARSPRPAAPTCKLARRDAPQRPARRSRRPPTVAELDQGDRERAGARQQPRRSSSSDLDDRNHAVEKDPRSPGGQGYTGFEALLQYVFDQTQAINIFDENGYMLKVNLFASECSDYQNADSLKARRCRRTRASTQRLRRRSSARTSRASRTPTRPTPASHDAGRRAPPRLRRRRRASPRRTSAEVKTPRTRRRPAADRQEARSRSCSTRRRARREQAVRPSQLERQRSRASRCPTLPPTAAGAAAACPTPADQPSSAGPAGRSSTTSSAHERPRRIRRRQPRARRRA